MELANHLQGAGRAKLAAVIEAARTRLRPILMTTAATVVGHFPLVLATGPGSGARNSIGIMPAVYLLVARERLAVAAGEAFVQEEEMPEAAGVLG